MTLVYIQHSQVKGKEFAAPERASLCASLLHTDSKITFKVFKLNIKVWLFQDTRKKAIDFNEVKFKNLIDF